MFHQSICICEIYQSFNIEVSPSLEQDLDDFIVTLLGSDVQRGVVFFRCCVYICFVLQQEENSINTASACCGVQRGLVLLQTFQQEAIHRKVVKTFTKNLNTTEFCGRRFSCDSMAKFLQDLQKDQNRKIFALFMQIWAWDSPNSHSCRPLISLMLWLLGPTFQQSTVDQFSNILIISELLLVQK